jgi:hypothetical protein
MESEQDQDGWNANTNTFSSTGTYNNEDYSMKTWGDEENPDSVKEMTDEERRARIAQMSDEERRAMMAQADAFLEEVEKRRGSEEQQDSQDPFDYTPWVAALPMPLTKEIEQGLRISGLNLRRQIQADLKRNPLLWDALRRPASLHNVYRSLAEMLVNLPQPDLSQFTELGDGHVHMSLATMEKYLYPTLFLMHYLHERGGNNLPGGIESMIAYSFFAQGHLPQSRTMHDLSVLRNTVFPTGLDLCFQIQDIIPSYHFTS